MKKKRTPRMHAQKRLAKVSAGRRKASKSDKMGNPPTKPEQAVLRNGIGKDMRQTPQREHGADEKVAKFVRSGQMKAVVQRLRERLYGLGEDALSAVEKNLREAEDPRLAYRLLMDMGVVPSPSERQMIRVLDDEIDLSELTSRERDFFADGGLPRTRLNLEMLREFLRIGAESDGPPMTEEELRHNSRVWKKYCEKHGDAFVMEPDREDMAEAEEKVRKEEEAEKASQAPKEGESK